MNNLLRNFDRTSFWLGFLAATLFWWLLARLRPLLKRLVDGFMEQAKASRLDRATGDEIRLGNDMLRRAQGWHLAAMLFSLDEILIPPRLVAPAPQPAAYEPPPSDDITDWAIPYTPDLPEFASFYNAPTLDVVEALGGGANLALIGPPGAGKSVALAYLACQLIRKAPGTEAAGNLIPLLLHVGELELEQQTEGWAEAALQNIFSSLAISIQPKRRLQALISLLEQGKLILLLDGLDELPPPQLERAVCFLEELLAAHPGLRVATCAHPDHLGRLPGLGFEPLALTSWNNAQRALLITRWSELWNQHVAEASAGKSARSDSQLIVGWLLNSGMRVNPLELSLKVWAAFAGDALGPGTLASLEAYVRRMTAGQPNKNRLGLEQMAAQMTLAMEPIIDRQKAEKWLGGSESVAIEVGLEDEIDGENDNESTPSPERVRARGALPDLIEAGLVVERSNERFALNHPSLAAYLASQKLAPLHASGQLIEQPHWSGRAITLKYLSILDGQSSWIENLAQPENQDPLQRGLILAGSWLQGAPDGKPWVPAIMRRLALCIQKKHLPLAIRARALYELALCNQFGVAILLRQLLEDDQPDVRRLAVLGLGYLRDGKCIEQLVQLIGDAEPSISRAALLALTAIGDKSGLEAVAYALLNGDESLRKAAAEALSNHPEEGHPTLEEGSAVEDAAVRRAAAFGLGRLGEPWTLQILEKLAAEDPQWIVQDAANQALNRLHAAHPRLPRPLPPLPQTAWLIAFAGERGVGVAPGKAAHEMLIRALQEGNDDQRLAALHYLGRYGDQTAVLPLYRLYFSSRAEVQEAAFNALWNFSASGIPLAPPVQYGFA